MTSNFAWLGLMTLWSIFRESDGLILPEGFRYAFFEVTTLKRLNPRNGQSNPEIIRYLLKIEGKGRILQLRQEASFLPKHFPIFSYNKEGNIQMDHFFISEDCFYHGFIQGEPSSLIALNSCLGGLRGLLQIGNKTYGIEPFLSSTTFQHAVYRVEQMKGDIHLSCGLTVDEQNHQEIMIGKAKNVKHKHFERNWWPHDRYVEVAIVVEHQLYRRFGKNQTFIALRVLEIIHIANTFYKPLGVHISVAGVEIWSEKNLIEIADHMIPLLATFNAWRRNELNHHLPNDAGHLFVYKLYKRAFGLAYTGKICSPQWASAVESYADYSTSFFAVVFAHELGHNLGMHHDTHDCQCERKSCIMKPFPDEVDQFSNCSYRDYFQLRDSPCLVTPPRPEKLFKFKFCGNKIVEDGEQCDCGSPLQCESDPCCQVNCKLRVGAVCNIGLCCDHCQHLPAGTVCRKRASSCDLPEYCNGTSPLCPKDVFVQDGAPCKDGARCYHGKCATHSRQCKMIFGKQARVAHASCFHLMNARGDRFGNCGLEDGEYKKCDANNMLCGRIQCENIYKLPSLMKESTVIQTSGHNTECWGTDFHGTMDIPDIGAVRDGTSCGSEMMCIHGECTNVSFLKYDCNVTKCHNRGICNTHKHCHCRYGWSPPDCLNIGYGGSIDSGPTVQSRTATTAGTIMGIIFALPAALSLGMYYWNELRCHFRRNNSKISPSHSMEGKSIS